MKNAYNNIDGIYVHKNDVETEPITKPTPTETPDTDKRKYPNPSTPPHPDVKPGPKN